MRGAMPAFDWLFQPARPIIAPWRTRVSLASLYVLGLVGWAYLLGWGQVPLDFHDWSGINVPRLVFLQDALRSGVWPLHMTGGAALHGVTDRYLALPDVITSPQAALLLILPVQLFVVVDVLIQYTIGFLGLLALRRYAEWSLFAFASAFLLFVFNGHILSHYSVGHFTWGAYFLFPWVVWLIFRFLDGHQSWGSVAGFATAMCYAVLTGGQHHMTWVLLLLALLIPVCRRRAWWLVAVVVASGLMGAVRLLPPALELASFRRAGLVSDTIGFPSVSHLIEALVVLRREVPAFNPALPGNIWFFDDAFYEFNAYVGGMGLAMLALGVYFWLRSARPKYPQLIVPLAVMIALSIGSSYRLIRALGIPLLDAERYSARMFSLPLAFLIVIAVGALDDVLRQSPSRSWQRGVALAALLFTAIDIAASVRLWRVAVSSGVFHPAPFNPSIATVVDRPDAVYVNVILAGVAVTLATAVVLAVLARRTSSPAG